MLLVKQSSWTCISRWEIDLFFTNFNSVTSFYLQRTYSRSPFWSIIAIIIISPVIFVFPIVVWPKYSRWFRNQLIHEKQIRFGYRFYHRSLKRKICVGLFMCLIANAILRELNSTGDMYAHLPDIADWLQQQESKINMSVLLISGNQLSNFSYFFLFIIILIPTKKFMYLRYDNTNSSLGASGLDRLHLRGNQIQKVLFVSLRFSCRLYIPTAHGHWRGN